MTLSASVLYFSALDMFFELMWTASSLPSDKFPSISSYFVRGGRVQDSLLEIILLAEWVVDEGTGQPGPLRIWLRRPRLKLVFSLWRRSSFHFLPDLQWACEQELWLIPGPARESLSTMKPERGENSVASWVQVCLYLDLSLCFQFCGQFHFSLSQLHLGV